MKPLPIDPEQRIVSLDIIRGVALLGIFLVNMPAFQWPEIVAQMYLYPAELSPLDNRIRLFFDVFIQGKFYTMFSFLFGLGFFLFLRRAEEKGFHIYRLFSRRMFFLALFGLFHLVVLWYGDILLTYALAAFFLLPFYRRKPRTIIIWAVILAILLTAFFALNILSLMAVPEQTLSELEEEGETRLAEAIQVYQEASVAEWLSYRWSNEVIPILFNIPFTIPVVLLMFLIGLYAGKRGILDVREHRRLLLRRIWWVCLVLSLPVSLLIIWLHLGVEESLGTYLINQLLLNMSGLFLSIFYMVSIVFLLQKTFWKRLFHPFSYAGRMALTNYIFQTVVGIGVFTGLGLFGDINLGLGVLICLIVFPLQIVISYYWLQRFQFGPLEWLWRWLTYGSRPPFKKIDGSSSQTNG